MQREKQMIGRKFIWGIILLVSLLAAGSKTFVGFDIDEGYALALPYRFLQGDQLFTQMWEVHQTSGIFASIILYPFLKITGSTTYLVIYVRIVCAIVHLLVSVFVYRVMRCFLTKECALYMAVVYYNFLPKWMMTVDFSMQFTWFFTICILCLSYEQYLMNQTWGTQAEKIRADQKRCLVMLLCGFSLAFLVLGYPTMLLLFPLWLFLILKRDNVPLKEKMIPALCLTTGCVLPAAVFLLYLFSYMSLPELPGHVKNVFSDGSHQFSGASKWSLWVGHGKDVIVQTIITMLPAAGITLVLERLYQKDGADKRRGEWSAFLLRLACVYTCLTSFLVIFANLCGIAWGPFRLQIRYLVMFAMGYCLAVRKKEEDVFCRRRMIRRIGLDSSLWALIGILVASNVGPTSSSSYLVLGVMAMLWLVMEEAAEPAERQSEAHRKKLTAFVSLTLGLFLLSLLFCKGYYVRVTGYPPSNIWMEREKIEEGPAKGIYVYPAERAEMQETYDLVREYTDASDQVLYLGTQALSNLYTDGKMVLPTTISTPAFNEQWITYFEQNPDRMPSVIFLSKTTVDDQEKFFRLNPFGQWIAAHYPVDERIDAEYVCVIRRP